MGKLYTTVCLFVCPAPRCIPAHTADAPAQGKQIAHARATAHHGQLVKRAARGDGKRKGGEASADRTVAKVFS